MLHYAEVATGQLLGRGDGLGIREVLRIQFAAQALVVPVEHEQQLVFAQGTVTMGEPQTAEQLLTGATSNAKKFNEALNAAKATTAEILGIATIQDNC